MELYGVVCNDERYGEQFVNDSKGGHLFFYYKEKEAQCKADNLNKEHESDIFVVRKVILSNVTNINNLTQIELC